MQRRSALIAASVFSGLLVLGSLSLIPRDVSLSKAPQSFSGNSFDDSFDDAEAAFGLDAPPLSNYVAREIARQGGASLPVLVPFAFTADEATARTYRFRLKLSGDGYTAVMNDGSRDIVITGAGGPAGDISENGLDYMAEYEDFSEEAGGSISFGFASCDYMVEFYCPMTREDRETGQANCIEAEEAQAFADELVSG